MITLDIAICTYGEDGVGRVEKMLLPPMEGVRYVVSWQEHHDAPVPDALMRRDDVSVHRLSLKGLSNNRNNAMAHCESDIVLIADDDLVYDAEGLRKVVRAFEDNPDIDLATFRVRIDGKYAKTYPADGTALVLPMPRGYYVASIEIAFRRERLAGLRFNPLLGLGAPEMHCGEEEVFVAEAIRRGAVCRHFNIDLCRHPGVTTGQKTTPGILMGQGCVIGVIYPVSGILRCFLKAYRLKRNGRCGFFYAFRYLAGGWRRRRRI